MTRFFYMDKKLFTEWETAVRQNRGFRELIEKTSESKFGIRLLNYETRAFELINHRNYMTFLLRYQ